MGLVHPAHQLTTIEHMANSSSKPSATLVLVHCKTISARILYLDGANVTLQNTRSLSGRFGSSNLAETAGCSSFAGRVSDVAGRILTH